MAHPNLPFSSDVVLIDVDPGFGKGAVSISGQAVSGAMPDVVIIGQSGAFDPIRTEYTISAGGDVVTITITDENGEALPGAKVWVDDRGPFTANAAAQVRFQATPGTHVLRVEADGRASVITEIEV